MGGIRSHQEVLIVHMRMVESIIRLLWGRLLALIDRVELVSDDSPLEKFLLRPLLLLLLLHGLHAIASILRQVDLMVMTVVVSIRGKPALGRAMVNLHVLMSQVVLRAPCLLLERVVDHMRILALVVAISYDAAPGRVALDHRVAGEGSLSERLVVIVHLRVLKADSGHREELLLLVRRLWRTTFVTKIFRFIAVTISCALLYRREILIHSTKHQVFL